MKQVFLLIGGITLVIVYIGMALEIGKGIVNFFFGG